MQGLSAGFREIEHTADWSLEAWAPDLPGLLEQAARGMYSLEGVKPAGSPPIERLMEIQADDAESLLVRFLSELLYLEEQEELVCDQFELVLNGYHLSARLRGAPSVSRDKEIKAVTYHNLQVIESPQGLSARIVFDV